MYCGEKAHLKRGNSEERADLVANQGNGDVWDLAAASVHVWVHGPAPSLICVDVHSSWNHLRQREKVYTGLMLSLTVWNPGENGSCTSSWQNRRAGPLDRGVGESGLEMWAWRIWSWLPLICPVVAWVGERCCPLTLADGRAVQEVIRSGQLPFSPTSYRTQESGASTLFRQHSRVDTVYRGMGESSPKFWVWESWTHYSSVMG